ncbi:hypothetical protein [Leptolyngbya sp. 7M]|uniref:hypothetical protein n=1 Tax=Leptolyngbya sp. 7M TaxID=2812896 RepID=UPI001B8D3F98|nr:hypothetical protein [Leptolyngbya sp. 7M]QYO62069.1 hypothetical protein JVX88_18275 [Leptolyngbya sp. 7M]
MPKAGRSLYIIVLVELLKTACQLGQTGHAVNVSEAVETQKYKHRKRGAERLVNVSTPAEDVSCDW